MMYQRLVMIQSEFNRARKIVNHMMQLSNFGAANDSYAQEIAGFLHAPTNTYSAKLTDDLQLRLIELQQACVDESVNRLRYQPLGHSAPVKLTRGDVHDGALWVTQNKTGAKIGIELTGQLGALVDSLLSRLRLGTSTYLIQYDRGQPLTKFALRSRFDKARELAKVNFQFRDIRAKAATDTGDLAHSQKLLAHKNRSMTEHYVLARVGERVKPTK